MPGFEPRDPDFAARVRQSFDRQGIMHYLGAELVAVGPGYCELRLAYRPELSQQHGYFHAGVIGTLADSAGGYAGYTLMPPDSSVLTVEYKLNLMAPARGDMLLARGEVIRAGRSIVVAKADVSVVDEGGEQPCAILLQTLMTMHNTPDSGARRSSRDGGARS